jgi:uncharacterized surface protein with fasciclin (FAS1) repeats
MARLAAKYFVALTIFVAAFRPCHPASIVRQLASTLSERPSNKTVLDVILGLTSDGGIGFDTNPDNFDILAHFLILANITTPLSDENAHLTVFAPSDGAFIRTANDFGAHRYSEDDAFGLVSGLFQQFSDTRDVALGAKLALLYHVSPQRLSSKDVLAAISIDTLGNAPPLMRNRKNPLALVDENGYLPDPELVRATLDIPASNGVVHGINRVLFSLKPFDSNLDNTDIYEHLISVSGLNLLRFAENSTLFIPPDSAFIQTANDFGANVMSEADAFVAIRKLFLALGAGKDFASTAREVMLYHMVRGHLSSKDLLAASSIETFASAPPLTHDPASPFALVDQALQVTNPQFVQKYLNRNDAAGPFAIDRVLIPVDINPKDVPVLGKPSPQSVAGANDSSCFPASAVVHISSIVHVSMDKLSAGMAVKVSADSGDASSKVYFFSHKMHTGWHEFIRISSASGHAVTLSSIHYIYANGKLTAASSVRIGDKLRTLDGTATVSAVETVRERGLFAPHTLHGDLVVNRVVVSTYTRAVHPTIAHALLAPVRALVRLGVSDEPLGNVMYEGGGWIKRFSSLLGGGTLLSMW